MVEDKIILTSWKKTSLSYLLGPWAEGCQVRAGAVGSTQLLTGMQSRKIEVKGEITLVCSFLLPSIHLLLHPIGHNCQKPFGKEIWEE